MQKGQLLETSGTTEFADVEIRSQPRSNEKCGVSLYPVHLCINTFYHITIIHFLYYLLQRASSSAP